MAFDNLCKHIVFGNEHTLVNIYTMSCETSVRQDLTVSVKLIHVLRSQFI